jgi:hypothetical protein
MAHVGKFNREVKYTNKDFAELRQGLINYAKNYFPNTYQDFNETSPGMMFIEMAAYVGDVMAFYNDVQLQESFLNTVDERINLYNLAQGHGYKPKTVVPASVNLEIFQLVPSIGEGVNTRPDYRYSLIIEPNMVCQTSDGIRFRTIDAVDFRFSSSFDPTETSVYSVTDDGVIEYYLLKKNVKAVSGEIRTTEYAFGQPKKYDKIVLPDTNVTEIISMTDSDGNDWYEVPFMAQDLVPISVRNTPYNNPSYSKYRSSVPYILCYRQVERRYVTRLRKDDLTEIQFGAGLSSEADEEIVPNPFNVAIGLDYFERVVDVSIDPMNFLYTRTYGTAPNDTTLTIQYAVSNGLSDNVNSSTINQIVSSNIVDPADTLDNSVLTTIRNSLAINNTTPAFGGANKKPLEVIREEAIANFAAQNRAVTKEDYILRCFTMPAKYGSVAKAYVEQDQQISKWNEYDAVPNPYALNLYVLGYDANRRFVEVNPVIKENLRNYLKQYRLMTDAVNIKTPYIVNIGIEFEIITRPQENSNEVILRCIEKLTKIFDPDKMEINSPILISKVYTELDSVDGVQTVQDIKFTNLYDSNQGYSPNVYDIDTAIRNGILYPSMDPMIFEVKYPKRDIRGRVNDL